MTKSPKDGTLNYSQWSGLPHHVIQQRFWWAWCKERRATSSTRPFDYDDLIQEANHALLDAFGTWDPNRTASFKTYAYASIYRRVSRYIDQNLSDVTMCKGWKGYLYDQGASNALKESIRHAAYGCQYFSDIREDADVQVEDPTQSEELENVSLNDWIQHCMSTISAAVGRENAYIMLEYYRGRSLSDISKDVGISRQAVKKRFDSAIQLARAALGEHDGTPHQETED